MRFEGLICPFCQNSFEREEDIVICSVCKTPHHIDCWKANDGCTSYGCKGIPLSVVEYENRKSEPIGYIPPIPASNNQEMEINKSYGSQFDGLFDRIADNNQIKDSSNDETKKEIIEESKIITEDISGSSLGANENDNDNETALYDGMPQKVEENSQINNNSSLYPCPDCGNMVSIHATFCPKCGRPLSLEEEKKGKKKKHNKEKVKKEKKKIKPVVIIVPIVVTIFVFAALFSGYYFLSPKTFQWCCYHRINPADCENAQTCSRCGKTWGEPLGHDWEKANCTEPQTCKICGATQGSPLGHTWKSADCYNPKECVRCGLTEGEPREHDYTSATCTEAAKCRYCGKTNGSPLGHDLSEYICRRCGECIVLSSDVPNIIDIKNMTYEVNYVGGIDQRFSVKNNSSKKTINYVKVKMSFFNAVGDKLKDDITRDDYVWLVVTGPIKPGASTKVLYWRACFYNSTYSGTTEISEIRIEYSDGTTLVIEGTSKCSKAVVAWR